MCEITDIGNGWAMYKGNNPTTIDEIEKYVIEMGITPSRGKNSITAPIKAIEKAGLHVPENS